ncbi:hypothetical protein PhCBS80983_g00437 [Powellomyces hirtus]|uniref:MIF4G domain-containing protein n=1 Tax=Powellomyces hirtus TaxID=109895 RepID=A0A507EGT4_9FUNG|nr:hypothetical protein PhCBS80983_g00437 [Powellomyces hirtus]
MSHHGSYNNNGHERNYDRKSPRYYHKSRRYQELEPLKSPEELKQEELTSSLFRLYDTDSDTKGTMESLASQICIDVDAYPEIVKKALKACISQMPHKVCLYGILSGLVNAQSSAAGAVFIEVAHDTIQDALKLNNFRTVKIMLRYLAELVNVNMIPPAQLITVYDLLLSVLNEPAVRLERTDAFVYALLASIPWAAADLNVRAPDELTRIMMVVETYMNRRRENLAGSEIPLAMEALATYRDVPTDWPYEQLDRLESLWRQIIDLKTNELWNTRILYRDEHFRDQLTTQPQHELKPLKLIYSGEDVQFSYQPVFRLFDDSLQTPDNAIIRLPSTRGISRFILEDLIYDIVRIFSLNHKEACRILFTLDTQLDSFYLEDEKIQHLASVVETLFGEMLRLPRSGERSVYYATVLMDMIKEDMQSIPKMIGRAVRTLYSRLDGPLDLGGGMDIEAVRRLVEWFAIHLSNFGHVWNWAAWEPVLQVEQTSTSFVFVRETLERSIRLAYWERIQGTIPESFADCNDIFPPHAPKTNFKFEANDASSDSPLVSLVATLRKSIASKAPSAEVSELLQQIRALPPAPTAMDGVQSAQQPQSAEDVAREAFIQCVMLQGSKSFSHVLNVVERYIGLLREYNSTEHARGHTVRIINDFWKYNTQFTEIILDKLTNYRVIDPKSIVSWVLDPAVLETSFTRFYIWAVLRSTLAKVNFKVEQLTLKLAEKKTRADQMNVDGEEDTTVDNADEITALDENRAAALREQKEVFLQVFQKFVDVIHAKIAVFNSAGTEPKSTPWFRWVVSNMREVARGFPNEVRAYKFTLDAIIFTDEVDPRIRAVWDQIKAVYAIHTDTLV